MKKQKLFNTAIATAMAAGAVVAVAPTDADAATKSFKDLTTNNSHYNTIMNLLERELISGYPNGTFKPNDAVQRGHAALIIANVLGLDKTNVTDPGFKDVPKTHPYYGAIAALANKGIIGGYADGSYGVKDTLTRGQMAVIIKNAFELEANGQTAPFTDIVKHPYKEHITALYVNKVTSGKTATKFDAASSVTRGQLSTFVVKAEEAQKEASKELTILEIKDGQVVTNKGTYDIDPKVAAVFTEANAAALKNALVGLEIEKTTTAVASLNNFVAAEAIGKIVGIKSLTITAQNVSFNGGNVSIPNVTVNGNNVVVNNVVADKIEVAKGLTVELKGVEVKELAVPADTKLTLDPTSVVDKITLPKGVKIEDVVTNYNEVKDKIKEVVEVDESGNENPTNPTEPGENTGGGGNTGGGNNGGGSTEATAAKTTVNSLIETVVTSTFAGYGGTYGEFEDKTAPDFTFNFNDTYKDTKLSVIKNNVEGSGSNIENDVINLVNLQNLGHFLNISSITATSAGVSSPIYNGIALNTPLDKVKEELGKQFNQSSVADALDEFMDHDTARDATVAEFVDQFETFNVTVTFRDGSTIPYTLTLVE
ncbi:S-layer homology domain-containing protein [Ureibacillus composti]|nr:S-layer homology domain-containing protein [Ureibacillus composti]